MFAFTLLRYLRVNFLQYINPSIIVCFPNSSVGLHPDAHFCVREICVYTNNADYIKYRIKKSEQFLSSSINVCLSKYSPTRSPFFCGDTPFCAFGYEIIDFYLTRKKTGRRYVLRTKNHTASVYREKARKKRWNNCSTFLILILLSFSQFLINPISCCFCVVEQFILIKNVSEVIFFFNLFI